MTGYEDLQVEAHRGTAAHEHVAGRVRLLFDLIDLIEEPAGRVLELGSHNGMETQHIVAVADEVVGFELGADYVAEAAARGIPRATFVIGDMHDAVDLFPLEHFDCVFANNCLEHARSARGPELLTQLWMLLRPGGQLVGATPPDALGAAVKTVPYHTWRFTPEEFRDALEEAGFVVEHWEDEPRSNVRWSGVHSPCSLQHMLLFRARRPA